MSKCLYLHIFSKLKDSTCNQQKKICSPFFKGVFYDLFCYWCCCVQYETKEDQKQEEMNMTEEDLEASKAYVLNKLEKIQTKFENTIQRYLYLLV